MRRLFLGFVWFVKGSQTVGFIERPHQYHVSPISAEELWRKATKCRGLMTCVQCDFDTMESTHRMQLLIVSGVHGPPGNIFFVVFLLFCFFLIEQLCRMNDSLPQDSRPRSVYLFLGCLAPRFTRRPSLGPRANPGDHL